MPDGGVSLGAWFGQSACLSGELADQVLFLFVSDGGVAEIRTGLEAIHRIALARAPDGRFGDGRGLGDGLSGVRREPCPSGRRAEFARLINLPGAPGQMLP